MAQMQAIHHNIYNSHSLHTSQHYPQILSIPAS